MPRALTRGPVSGAEADQLRAHAATLPLVTLTDTPGADLEMIAVGAMSPIEGFLGKNEMDVLRALKNHFDPNNIMNPGSQLGLNVPDELKR